MKILPLIASVLLAVLPVYAFDADDDIYCSAPDSGISAADNFNRSDSSTLGSLSGGTYSWSETIGDMAIAGNQVTGSGNNATDVSVLATAVSVNSGTIVAALNAGVYSWGVPGVVFGYVDSSNFWVVEIAPSSGTEKIRLVQYVSGTPTVIASDNTTITINTDYVVTVVYTATTCNVSIAAVGTNLIAATSLTIATGNIGIKSFDTGDASSNIDDWSYIQ